MDNRDDIFTFCPAISDRSYRVSYAGKEDVIYWPAIDALLRSTAKCNIISSVSEVRLCYT